MDEELFLKELHTRTNPLVWALFFIDLAIVVSAPTATTRPVWGRSLMLALELSMTLLFALRKDYIRAAIFGVFTINSFSMIVN